MYEQKYNRYKFKYLCLQLQKAGYNPIMDKDGKITDADFSINFNAAAFAVIDCPGENNERTDDEEDCSANPHDKTPLSEKTEQSKIKGEIINKQKEIEKKKIEKDLIEIRKKESTEYIGSAKLITNPKKDEIDKEYDLQLEKKNKTAINKWLTLEINVDSIEDLIKQKYNETQQKKVTPDSSETHQNENQLQADLKEMKIGKKEKCKRTKTLQYVASMFLAMLYNKDKLNFEKNINSMINSKVGNCQYKTDEEKKKKKNHLTKYFIRVINKINTNLKDLSKYLTTDFTLDKIENEKDQQYGSNGTDKLLHNSEYAQAHLENKKYKDKDYYTSTVNTFFSEENLKEYLHFIQGCNLEVKEIVEEKEVIFKVKDEKEQVTFELPIIGETQLFDKDTKCVDEYDKFVKCQQKEKQDINSTKECFLEKKVLNECRKDPKNVKKALTDLVFQPIKKIPIELLKQSTTK
jgi:hypothetical protein